MKFILSPSSINLMEECPRCFWLDKHKVWQRPEIIPSSLMNGMDKIIKAHFDKFRDKGRLPPELENSECKHKGCKLFNDIEKLKIWRNNLIGISWEDKDGHILRGAIDNLLVNGKKMIVLDYKTRGFPLKETTADHYQNQLDIYTLLLEKNGYETEDYSFLLFYIPKEVLDTGEVIFDTELVKRKVNPKRAYMLFRKSITILEGECPKKTCKWCERI
ncbi:MAG: PD-(D/E)XK nuclease family protein [Candidatus Pacearchaeota archaeon]